MTTYFAVHNDCIFKNPSLFYGKRAACDCKCAQPSPAQCALLNLLRICGSAGAGAAVGLCGRGILVVLLLSKECTASCVQRAF